MLKKINIIIVSFFIPLTIAYNYGFFLLIPILLFYVIKDYKNLFYALIPSLLSTLIFNFNKSFEIVLVFSLIVGLYFLISLLNKKVEKLNKYTSYIISSLILIINILMYFIFNRKANIYIYFSMSLISSLLYIYLDAFLIKLIHSSSNEYSIMFLDGMLILLSVLGAINKSILNVNLGLLLGAYFIMYSSRTYKNMFSPIISILLLIIGYGVFNISEFIFIPVISGLYFVDNIFIMIPTNVILIFGIFLPNTMYDKAAMIGLMGITIIFEILGTYVINKHQYNEDATEHIYEKIQNTTSQDMLNFALFLDKFSVSFKNPKEYNEQLSSGMKDIIHNHCLGCQKNKECFDRYKTNLYTIFKNMLINEDDYLDIYPEFNEFCLKVNSIKRTAKLYEKNLSLSPEIKSNNNILVGQMNGFSNTIKKYVLDINSKTELSYYELMLLKKALIDYGYNITYFEISKQYIDDFLIVVGIKNQSFDSIKDIIHSISAGFIKQDLSVVLYKEQDDNIYINIIPKIKIDVTYGFGSLSAEEVDICGDNYLVKEMKNGKFISAISDGMGKGYRAFYESDTTLKLIEDIISLNINSDTALEILNTYYTLQDYLEEYATLDFLEINRYNKHATFYKMGATTSYVFKKNGKIDKIINKNLPFGIDEEVDMNIYNLDTGDLILMSSDGIFENIIDVEDFETFIGNIKNYPPQRIVYEILNYTLSHKIKAKDDMSIIALKIQQAA